MTTSVICRSIDQYDVDNVNRVRLKVNRVNLVQTIKVDDELLSELRQFGLIDSVEHLSILKNSSQEEKIRFLIDCLATRKHTRKDWYIVFRKVLIEKNYTDLITFLDNTIIKKPKFVKKFYSSSTRTMFTNATNNEFFSGNLVSVNNFANSEESFQLKTNRTNTINIFENFNENNFEALQKKFPTYSVKPNALFAELEVSKDSNDQKQLVLENECFELFQKLELIYSLHKSNQSLFILDTQTFKKVLNPKHTHYYMKYFKNLVDLVKIDLSKYLKDHFLEKLREEKILKLKHFTKLDDLVFNFVSFLTKNDKYEHADEILLEYLKYLNFVQKETEKSQLENKNDDKILLDLYASRFLTFSYSIIVKNNLFDFKSSLEIYDKAYRLLKNQLTGTNVNTSVLFYAIGFAYYENGKFNQALDFFIKSLKVVDYESEILIDLLGVASMCYLSKWMIKEGEALAILGVKAAKRYYGTNSLNFVKSLLYYSYFSNEFIQDNSTVEVCEYTLKLAKRVFGFDSLAVADAYRVCSKALITNKVFQDTFYFDYAQKALKIASEFFTANHPKLINYEICFVSGLQWKSINAQELEVKTVCLNDAYNLCLQTIKLSINIYGQENYVTAKIYRMLGSLLYYMERDIESEEIHKFSLELMEAIFSANSLHYLLAKSTLGNFYKLIGEVNDAVAVFLEVVNKIKQEDINYLLGYSNWIPSIYSNLSECYRIKRVNDLASRYKKQADNLKIIASKNSAKKHDLLNVEINRHTPENLNSFLCELIDGFSNMCRN